MNYITARVGHQAVAHGIPGNVIAILVWTETHVAGGKKIKKFTVDTTYHAQTITGMSWSLLFHP